MLYLGRNDNVNTFTFSWLAIGEVVPELDPVITLEIVYNRVAPGPVVHPMEISVIGTSQAVAQQIYTNEASPLYVSAVGGHVLETSAFNFPPITAPAGAITNISTGGNGSLTRVFITNDGALQSTGNLNVDGSAVVVWTCQPHTTITLEMSNVPFNTLVSISNNAGGNPVYVSTLYGFLQT